MKRILLSLIVMGGLMLMAAPQAGAVAPGLCGKSYSFIVNGADETTTTQTGGTGLPGAVTTAVGVGTITFGAASGTGCAVTQGEMIYNAGDLQTNPAGLYFGPAVCYSSASALGTGIPCFDGGDHFTSGTLSPSANGNGAFTLAFTAGAAWVDGSDETAAFPFGFTIQDGLGSSTAVGTSIPAPGAPVLTITLQKQKTQPAPTVFGTAPYLGQVAISCSGFGANLTDFVANIQDAAPGVAGGFGSTVGALAIFDAAHAGGSLSFNSNDNFGVTTTPANANDCSFSDLPGNECSLAIPGCSPEPSAYGFADGTSNSVAFVTSTGNSCGLDNTAGAGYATSTVIWGATDTSAYLTVTGLVSAAAGFVPPGDMSTCTTYEQAAAAGHVSNITTDSIVSTGTLKTGTVKVANASPADCDIEVSMASASAEGCSLSLAGGSPTVGDSPADSPSTVLATTNCTCAKAPPSGTVSSTLSIASESCALFGTTSYTVTCKN
jgi:hypothetical protein